MASNEIGSHPGLARFAGLEESYEVVRRLTSGGMGNIFLVRHRRLDELRVIKVMRSEIADDPTLRQRFEREARIAAQLRHRYLAQIYDYATREDGDAYLVLEYIDGITFEQVIKARPMVPPRLAVALAGQAAVALAFLHGRAFVHRDIAPDNLMLTRDGDDEPVVKLIDLGIAKPLEGSGLTSVGAFLGKLWFASPEQLEGGAGEHGPIGPASDLYSLGLVLYELLTGRFPYTGATSADAVQAHLFKKPHAFEMTDPQGRLPAPLRALVLQCLEKRPADRPASAQEVASRLRAIEPLLPAASESDERVVARLLGVAGASPGSRLAPGPTLAAAPRPPSPVAPAPRVPVAGAAPPVVPAPPLASPSPGTPATPDMARPPGGATALDRITRPWQTAAARSVPPYRGEDSSPLPVMAQASPPSPPAAPPPPARQASPPPAAPIVAAPRPAAPAPPRTLSLEAVPIVAAPRPAPPAALRSAPPPAASRTPLPAAPRPEPPPVPQPAPAARGARWPLYVALALGAVILGAAAAGLLWLRSLAGEGEIRTPPAVERAAAGAGSVAPGASGGIGVGMTAATAPASPPAPAPSVAAAVAPPAAAAAIPATTLALARVEPEELEGEGGGFHPQASAAPREPPRQQTPANATPRSAPPVPRPPPATHLAQPGPEVGAGAGRPATGGSEAGGAPAGGEQIVIPFGGGAEVEDPAPPVAAAVLLIGRVRSLDGTPLPGVVVRLVPDDGGEPRSTVTGADGTYQLVGLAAGGYLAELEREGFATARSRLRLQAGKRRYDVGLQALHR